MRQSAVILTAGMLLALSECAATAGSDLSVKELRCEYRINPLGVDVVKPRLNWILQSSQRGQKQTAYHVLVAGSREKLNSDEGDLWDSGKVESGRYQFVSLMSRLKRSY